MDILHGDYLNELGCLIPSVFKIVDCHHNIILTSTVSIEINAELYHSQQAIRGLSFSFFFFTASKIWETLINSTSHWTPEDFLLGLREIEILFVLKKSPVYYRKQANSRHGRLPNSNLPCYTRWASHMMWH